MLAACGLELGPGERLRGEPSLIGLIAWSVSQASLPDMGLT